MEERATARVYFIDWLRILAVLLLFPFHTLRVFDSSDPFYVKASPLSDWVGSLLGFISVWHMPLLFFLAGCSTYFALRKRRAGQYAWERVKRLLVPFVFGFFILIPPQTWFGGRFNSSYKDSYWHYLSSGDFLKWNIQDGGDYFGGFGIGHLWFILFLLLISLAGLAVTSWSTRGRAAGGLQAFCRFLAKPWGWIVPLVILYLAGVAPEIPGGPIFFYLFLFLLGFVAVCDPKFMEAAQRYRVPALVLGLGLALFHVLSVDFRESFPDPSWQRGLLAITEVAACWFSIVGMLGFGKRYLDRTSPAQRYLAEGSYPVYILHQTVIVTIAFYVVQIAAPRPVLWLILFVATLLCTFGLYEVVRRLGVLRFLFGMKGRKKEPRLEKPASAIE
jgi:glucan biosynthesis protein C